MSHTHSKSPTHFRQLSETYHKGYQSSALLQDEEPKFLKINRSLKLGHRHVSLKRVQLGPREPSLDSTL